MTTGVLGGGVPGERVYALVGEVDFAEAPRVENEIRTQLTTDGVVRVILDCAALEFMDSSGIGMLVTTRQLAGDEGKQLVLRGLAPKHERLLDMVGLLSLFTIESAKGVGGV